MDRTSTSDTVQSFDTNYRSSCFWWVHSELCGQKPFYSCLGNHAFNESHENWKLQLDGNSLNFEIVRLHRWCTTSVHYKNKLQVHRFRQSYYAIEIGSWITIKNEHNDIWITSSDSVPPSNCRTVNSIANMTIRIGCWHGSMVNPNNTSRLHCSWITPSTHPLREIDWKHVLLTIIFSVSAAPSSSGKKAKFSSAFWAMQNRP